MKVYTRRGDGGQTDLFGGERVAKDALRVEAYGAVDELNAALGVAAAASVERDVCERLARIQALLFALGGSLATPDPAHRAKSGLPEPTQGDIDALEQQIDAFGMTRRCALCCRVAPAAAALHVARTVCRRRAAACSSRATGGRPDYPSLPQSAIRSPVRDGARREPARGREPTSSGRGSAVGRAHPMYGGREAHGKRADREPIRSQSRSARRSGAGLARAR